MNFIFNCSFKLLLVVSFCLADKNVITRVAVPVTYEYGIFPDLETAAAEPRSVIDGGLKYHQVPQPLPLVQVKNEEDPKSDASGNIERVHKVEISHKPMMVSYNYAKSDLNPSASYHVSEGHGVHESDHGSYSSHESGKYILI